MDSPLQIHAERLAWRLQSWTSIDMEIEGRFARAKDWAGQPQDFDAQTERYIETAAGQRHLDSQSFKDGVVRLHNLYYFDGHRGANVIHDPKHPDREQTILVHRHFGLEDRGGPCSRPIPYLWEWVGQIPLHEALTNAKVRVIGQSQVMGHACDVVLIPDVGPPRTHQFVYHLDQATSVPLRFLYYLSETKRQQGEPYSDWTAESLDEIQGYPFVRKSTDLQYSESPDPSKPYATFRYEVTSLHLNREYPETAFRPAYHPGATVFDSTTKKPAYQVPGESNVPAGADTATVVPNAPRADIPTAWPFTAMPIFLGLGLCLLGAYAILRRRVA